MNSAGKFNSFKQSLVSAGKNSQVSDKLNTSQANYQSPAFQSKTEQKWQPVPSVYELNNSGRPSQKVTYETRKTEGEYHSYTANNNMNTHSGISQPSKLGSNIDGKGAIRSALKFDYEQNGMRIQSSKIKSSKQIPSANIFSCMDNPNYQRDFEVTPKLMHK